MAILDGIKNSSDIKKLNIDELKTLSEELRKKIIATTKNNGGHLSSNLGVIETTLAIHYVFDLPKDKLIFDVGHQCYAHKLLSGRKDGFDKIRTDEGISGFPSREESEFDIFTTGHAGASISSSLGLLEARNRQNEDYCVIDVVGDGSIVNGLNLEAITASEEKPKNFIVILNDNEMSISKNVNGFYKIISKGTAKQSYLKKKDVFKKIFGESFITRFLRKIRNGIKRALNKNGFLFEKFGFKYVGVIDGNDIEELVKVLTRIKDFSKDKAVLLHVKTKKGKGMESAEEHSDYYHGVGKDFKTSEGVFGKTLGNTLADKIEKDKKIVAIAAAMKDGTGLKTVEEKFPNNFIDVGIAEEFAVTEAAGMAAGGLKPFVCIYSTFLQRSFDQILHDVCLSSLPVTFCIDRAGLVGADGKTHQGVFDLSYLLPLPNMKIFAPATSSDLKLMIDYALSANSPIAIRYPNISEEVTDIKSVGDVTKWQEIVAGDMAVILAVGPRMLKIALGVSEKIKGVGVVNARTVKPLDADILNSISDKVVITLEENAFIGGFGEYVKSFYSDQSTGTKVLSYGVKDEFIKHGSIKNQLIKNGLCEEEIILGILSVCAQKEIL